MPEVAQGDEQALVPINGDILEAILSHVPLVGLLAAYHVSTEWRAAVRSSLSTPSRAKPWLIAYIHSPYNPSSVVTRVYDPVSNVWIEFANVKKQLTCLPIHASHSNLIYTLTPSKLSFSLDAMKTKWHDIDGPKIWRSDPIVAVMGSKVVVAGGTCDFEDDSLAVEIYDGKSRKWEICQSMPDFLKGSAAATWLSVAVTDQKLFCLEKTNGTLCIFDPETKAWEGTFYLKPNESIFCSLIGFSNNRLVLVGLLGHSEDVESLRVWEVNCETFSCDEIGRMPSRMLEEFIDSCSSPSSIDISMGRDMVYIYNSSEPKSFMFCELHDCSCSWGLIQDSLVNDENLMHRFVFTCSKVGINDLQRAFDVNKRS